jgi:hypothetical protein
MGDPCDFRNDVAVFRTPDGLLVVEIDLARYTAHRLERLIADARSSGADRVWAHGVAVDASIGFRRRGGYARLEAPAPPASVDLAPPPRTVLRELHVACFGGVWGHHELDEPDPAATYVGLREGDRWVGLCEFDGEGRWIAGPGVAAGLRTPDRYTRLVRGAAAHMERLPVVLETWGDSEETLAAYRELGFVVAEYVPGWELVLQPEPGSDRSR